MEIHVSNIGISKTVVLIGHKAPVLGVALDPKEKYVVSIYQGQLFVLLSLFSIFKTILEVRTDIVISSFIFT
jgi:hypothetical protein